MSTAMSDFESALQQAGVTTRGEIDALIADSVLRMRSLQSVGAAVSRMPVVEAGFTRAIQATENAWQVIEREFGLLTSTEVARRIGSKSPHRTLAATLRAKGEILGVSRLNAYRYPGFQFTDSGDVRPVIPELIAAAEAANWTAASLALWLCNSSGTFAGDRPVDHLDDPGMAEVSRDAMLTDW